MKRKFRNGDTVKIGKFGSLSSFQRYENKCGEITTCRQAKVMGFWVYEVLLFGGERQDFTEGYILPRPARRICDTCSHTFDGFRGDMCPECAEDYWDLDTDF